MYHLTEEQINEYIDHLLTSVEAEEVERHMLRCNICKKKVDELQQVFAALADLPEEPFQKDLATRVLRLVEPPPTTVPENKPPCVLHGWGLSLAWTIAALQIPLAGLALLYAWPILQDWLIPIKSYFSQPWQWLSLGNGLSVWWNGWNASEMTQSILAWSSQVQQVVENLEIQPRVLNWNTQEGMLILAVLLVAWASGNYLLFHLNRKVIQ